VVERLFFALWPPAGLREQLVALREPPLEALHPLDPLGPLEKGLEQQRLGTRASGTSATPPNGASRSQTPRLTHPQDLHLTLVFVGAVEAHLRPCVEAAGDDVACSGFALRFDRIGAWARQRLWVAEPLQVPDRLFGLVSQLQQNLLVCGVEPEKRRYRPHLTLARKAPPIEAVPLRVDWPVTEFVLAASRSGRRPSYQIVRRWPLDG
jgi:2'-5' RNA ligase